MVSLIAMIHPRDGTLIALHHAILLNASNVSDLNASNVSDSGQEWES